MNELQLFSFDGNDVEVIELNGEVLFNPYHVAECLGIAEVRSSIRNFNDNQVVKVRNSDVQNMHIRKLNNAGENFLTESGVYKLVFKSHKPNAERFTDWIADEVLPQIRKTGSYTKTPEPKTFIEQGASIVKFIADDLGVNEASRILMYENYCKDVGIPTGFLPAYEHNGSRIMKSLSALLEENNCQISAHKFNKILVANGYVSEEERNSSKGIKKRYKALTEKGRQYGENVINTHNQREVQPLYYKDTFMDLYNSLMGHGE